MFETMRRNMKLIMWITAGSFVLLIFLAWGLEYQGMGRGGRRSAGVIGSVNGQPIRYTLYQDQIDQIRAGYVRQGQTIDDATEVQVRDQAWKGLTEQMLMGQEIKRRGIEVSDREIVEAIRDQPLPEIMQSPDFQTDGKFDYSKYLAALSDPSRDWLVLENYYRNGLPAQKLQHLVISSVKVSDADVRRQFEADNTKAKVAYAFVAASRFPIDPAGVDESAVRSYYGAHTQDYQTDAQAWVQYARIEKKPSFSDSLAARDLIQQAAKEALGGEEFSVLVSAYSEAPVQLRGGEQGTYVSREQFSAPAVREAAFSLPIGQVSDILSEPNGYHLIRVEDRRKNGEKEEVKIADIFVPITLSSETTTGFRDKALGILNGAKEAQGNLAEAAQKEEVTISERGPFGRRTYIPSLGQLSGFMDWAFNATEGRLNVMEGPDAWYVIRLVRRRPAGVAPYEDVKDRVRADYTNSLQVDSAKPHGEQILSLVRSGTPLEQAAKGDTTCVFDRTEEFARRGFVRGLGNDPAVIARVFTDPVGLVPQVVATKRGAYVIEILSRTTPDESLFASQKDAIRRQLVQRRRSDIVNRWMEQLRTQAKIEDYRGDEEL